MATFCNIDPWIPIIADIPLFQNISVDLIPSLLDCIDACVYQYDAQEIIVLQQQAISTFGMMLSGRGRAFLQDADGKNITLSLLEKGSEIGIIVAANPGTLSPVSVQAQANSAVLMIPFATLLRQCPSHCEKHQQLLINYISVLANKGLALHDRIACLLKPSVRDKIWIYLRRCAKEQGTLTFSIPMNRYELSEYLNIERSALSRELSRMKKEGLLVFYKNSFQLHS